LSLVCIVSFSSRCCFFSLSLVFPWLICSASEKVDSLLAQDFNPGMVSFLFLSGFLITFLIVNHEHTSIHQLSQQLAHPILNFTRLQTPSTVYFRDTFSFPNLIKWNNAQHDKQQQQQQNNEDAMSPSSTTSSSDSSSPSSSASSDDPNSHFETKSATIDHFYYSSGLSIHSSFVFPEHQREKFRRVPYRDLQGWPSDHYAMVRFSLSFLILLDSLTFVCVHFCLGCRLVFLSGQSL
jgi:hypothetical protein